MTLDFLEFRHAGVGRYPAMVFKMQMDVVLLRKSYLIDWIPANAGMTKL